MHLPDDCGLKMQNDFCVTKQVKFENNVSQERPLSLVDSSTGRFRKKTS